MDSVRSKQVTIAGLDDKRQITVVLATTKDGNILAPQVIYADKTTRSVPKVDFPDGWHVTYRANHWSTEETMLQYVDHVIVHYVKNNRESSEQKAIAIFDVFQAQRCQSVLGKLTDNNIQVVFVPACCTDKLQPLDLTVNKDTGFISGMPQRSLLSYIA